MKLIRQGDVLLVPVSEVPADVKPVARENGLVILAHGEVTGHHHAIRDDQVELVTSDQASDLRMWLSVTANEPVELTHQEHNTLLIPPGFYEVVGQREYTPEAPVRVQD